MSVGNTAFQYQINIIFIYVFIFVLMEMSNHALNNAVEQEQKNITEYYRNNQMFSTTATTLAKNTNGMKELNASTINNEFPTNCIESNGSHVMVQCKDIPSIVKFNGDSLIVTMLDPNSIGTDTTANLGEKIKANEQLKSINRHVNHNLQKTTAIYNRARASTNSNSRICNYLNCKRNCSSRITPIIEETDNEVNVFNSINDQHSTTTNLGCCLNPMKSCWPSNNNTEDIEIYNTQTIIKEKSVNRLSVVDVHQREIKHQEVQTVCHNPLEYSQHDNIYMSQHGTIINCDNDNNHNNDNTKNKQNANYERWLKYKKLKSSKFHYFYWLMRPFRGKYTKPKKSTKIHAVVYKTYFVKWTKPPDSLTHGFGVKRYKPFSSFDLSQSSSIRRCRSATF